MDIAVRWLAAALVLRRASSLCRLCCTRAWLSGRLASRERWAAAPRTPVHVVVPLYQEQELVASTVQFWHERCVADPDLHVALVTTEKEGSEACTTAALTRAAVEEAAIDRLRHMHVREVHPYRAVQLNAAVEAVRAATIEAPTPAWIGVYNADSRPCASTFDELRFAITAEPELRAYQQLAQYTVSEVRPASRLMESFAALQTWWTYTSWTSRVRRGRSAARWWAAPFSTFGHGEFVRLDALDEIGGFPDFAYADGLLLGWMLLFAGYRVEMLASPDFAEVPRDPAELVRQHRAWIRGLLNVRAAARRASRCADAAAVPRTVVAGQLGIVAGWGLRPFATLGMAVWGVGRLSHANTRASGGAVLGALVIYCAVPQLASTLYRRGPGHDVSQLRPLPVRLRQLFGAPVTLLLDGLGAGPALWDALTSDQPPPKTRR